MNWLKQLIRQLRCPHTSQTHVRNIHGDEINHSGGMRSVWKCDACGAKKLHAELKEGGYSLGQAMVEEAKAALTWDEVCAMEQLVIKNNAETRRRQDPHLAQPAPFELTLEEMSARNRLRAAAILSEIDATKELAS